ncbi:MAG: hypothetical protein RR547_00505 [Raoultibacter sp.]
MTFIKTKHYEDSIGILYSMHGLVQKAGQGIDTMAVVGDDGKKTLEAGTLFESDDLLGIVFEDYDMTEHADYPISVVVAGHVRADRITAEALAKKTAFATQGLFIHGEAEVVQASAPAGDPENTPVADPVSTGEPVNIPTTNENGVAE